MDIHRTPTASVTVISDDVGLFGTIARALADETTTVAHRTLYRRPADAETMDRPDVIVIDRQVVQHVDREILTLRRRWPTVEVVVVNASDERQVQVLLDAGADDVVLAGSPALAARLNARTRRARTVNAGSRIAVGDVVFDREARRVWCAGREIELTPREHALLDCLFWHAPNVATIPAILEFVWGMEAATVRRTLVEVYVGYLRRKIAHSQTVAIRTVRGVGYQFAARP